MFLSLFLLIAFFSYLSANDVVTGKIVGNEIIVHFSIPEGQHQTLQKDYFYIEPDSIKGVVFEPTIYPKGVKEGDLINYHNSVTLKRKFHLTKDFDKSIKSIKVYAGYQFCKDSGMCFFPQEVELNLPFNPDNIKKDSKSAATTSHNNKTKKSSTGKVLYYILLAFLGGIILNVMPCI